MALIEPDHKNPNIDRIEPEPAEPDTGPTPSTNPGEPEIDRPQIDRPEVEDDLRPTREPEMVPPGHGVDNDIDLVALAADRAVARTSDHTDARDGVDGSDAIGRDPDGVGGKPAVPTRTRRN